MEALRSDIKELYAKLARGDVRDRDFQRRLAEKSVELYRTAAQGVLKPGERILAEHHVVYAHMKLAQSVLREPDQEAVSLFASECRVVRVRAMITPGRPVSCDDQDGTEIEEVPYSRIRELAPRREFRKTEMVAGVIIVLLALVFHSYLTITGTILVLLGAAGVLHGLLLPTRWVEVVTEGEPREKPIVIHGLWRKTGRRLLAVLREKLVVQQDNLAR